MRALVGMTTSDHDHYPELVVEVIQDSSGVQQTGHLSIIAYGTAVYQISGIDQGHPMVWIRKV